MKNSNNDYIDIEPVKVDIIDVMQGNDDNVKGSKKTKPTYKQMKFAKAYKEGNTMGNATKSAIKAGYSEASAHVQGSVLLKNPKVLMILNEAVEEAEDTIRDLMLTSDSESIRLASAKEVLDRTIGKPVQRNESVNLNITVESMLDEV